ncbi:MAG: amidohydrolase family protein [Gemmatimonadetes bacterium]|nr:amidohydrolase family protein [Gemmatimonadota bacterium]
MRYSNSRFGLGAATVAALLAFGSAHTSAQAKVGVEGTFLIRGGTVVVGTGERLEGTSVLIQDGRIAAIGSSVTAPDGATVIDATGQFVYAGMIDSYTPMGLAEIGRISTMQMSGELGQFNPHLRAMVAINTGSVMLGITRSNGVTSAITAPTGGIISGQAALINMDGWTWEDMALNGNAGYVVNYPSAQGGGRRGGRGFVGFGGGGEDREARAREQLEELKQEIRLARSYHIARQGGLEDEDLVYESMRPLVSREVPAIMRVNSQEDIEGAVALGEELEINIIIAGGRDAWKVRDLLAEKNIPVVLGSIRSTPGQGLPYDAVYAQPGVLVAAGVKIAFSTGSASNARHVPYHAALATAYGLSPEDAWKALTIWPAEIWHVDDEIGTVEEGKLANLFVADGDPLDIRTNVSEVFIKGRRVPMDDRATRLYEKHNARPKNNR